MIRNIDMVALRSFVAVAETGGMTRAAAKLHLTQSAVSMQIKRLEIMLGHPLVDRVGRGIALTGNGELLLAYARRMLALHDEAWTRLTAPDFEGELKVGVPHDIIKPHIPMILNEFLTAFPRVKVQLVTFGSKILKSMLAASEIDIILTTEQTSGPGAELLSKTKLVWQCRAGSDIWKQRPLAIANEPKCIFRPIVLAALDDANVAWDTPFSGSDWREFAAFVSAGMAVVAILEDTQEPDWGPIPACANMPALPVFGIYMYINEMGNVQLAGHMAAIIRDAFYRQPAMQAAKSA